MKNYHSQISYGHHYKNYLPIILLKCMKIQYAFVYIKSQNSKKRMYPDNIHAFSFEKIIFLKDILTECKYLLGSKNKRNYYNKILNEKKISF